MLTFAAALLLLVAVGRGIWSDIKFHRKHGWDAMRRQTSDRSQEGREATYATVADTSAPRSTA